MHGSTSDRKRKIHLACVCIPIIYLCVYVFACIYVYIYVCIILYIHLCMGEDRWMVQFSVRMIGIQAARWKSIQQDENPCSHEEDNPFRLMRIQSGWWECLLSVLRCLWDINVTFQLFQLSYSPLSASLISWPIINWTSTVTLQRFTILDLDFICRDLRLIPYVLWLLRYRSH